MAEVIGITASAITLASLFSTCIDCFDYFKAAQAFKEDADLLLVKLDLEKARLLIWGNNVGILDGRRSASIQPLDNLDRTLIVERCLESIKALLTDADDLQFKYGLQTATGPEARAEESRRLISSNGMSTFKASYNRFLARSNGLQGRPHILSRAKWAIRDKKKFDVLVCCLRDLINGLIEVFPVMAEAEDRLVKEDIASINDLRSLRLVERACEESYPDWSAKASAIIEASELGTVDRRNVEEWLRDGSAVGINSQGRENITANPTPPKMTCAPMTVLYTSFFVLTGNCQISASSNLCDVRKLGENCNQGKLGFASDPPHRWNLGKRITSRINLRNLLSIDGCDLSRLQSRIVEYETTVSVKMSPRERLPPQERPRIPMATVHVYCAPCVRQIHTAFDICRGSNISPLFEFSIRVDDRIPSSCCPDTKGIDGLVSLINWIKETEYETPWKLARGQSSLHLLDRPWIEERIYQAEQETYQPSYWDDPPGNIRRIYNEVSFESGEKSIVVILGEVGPISLMMECPPFPQDARKPRETEMFEIYRPRNSETWLRNYIGSYSRNPKMPDVVPGTSTSRFDGTNQTTQFALASPATSSRRTASPASPKAKRQKLSASVKSDCDD